MFEFRVPCKIRIPYSCFPTIAYPESFFRQHPAPNIDLHTKITFLTSSRSWEHAPNIVPQYAQSAAMMARKILPALAGALVAATLMLSTSTSAFQGFHHAGLPTKPPSNPAQCTPAGPRVDHPTAPTSVPALPGLLSLPHSRHVRAAQKIQVHAHTHTHTHTHTHSCLPIKYNLSLSPSLRVSLSVYRFIYVRMLTFTVCSPKC